MKIVRLSQEHTFKPFDCGEGKKNGGFLGGLGFFVYFCSELGEERKEICVIIMLL